MTGSELAFVIIANVTYLLWVAENWWWRNVRRLPDA